jgi:hypothetical protein
MKNKTIIYLVTLLVIVFFAGCATTNNINYLTISKQSKNRSKEVYNITLSNAKNVAQEITQMLAKGRPLSEFTTKDTLLIVHYDPEPLRLGYKIEIIKGEYSYEYYFNDKSNLVKSNYYYTKHFYSKYLIENIMRKEYLRIEKDINSENDHGLWEYVTCYLIVKNNDTYKMDVIILPDSNLFTK